MTTLTILITLAVAVPTLWLLVQTGAKARWLAIAIPLLLAAPIGLYAYGTSLLGYAVATSPTGQWELLYARVDDANRQVLALVQPPAGEPRLYTMTRNFEQKRRQFGQAQARVASGVAVGGRPGSGDADGEFVLYDLPPAGLPQKDS